VHEFQHDEASEQKQHDRQAEGEPEHERGEAVAAREVIYR